MRGFINELFTNVFCSSGNKRFSRNFSYIITILLVLNLCVLLTGCGGKDDSGGNSSDGSLLDDETSATKQREKEEKRQQIKELAQKRFEEALAKEPKFDYEGVLQKLVLAKLKVDLNKIVRGRTKDQVEKIIKARADEATEGVYSDDERRQVVQQAEKEFRLYRLHDNVTVTTRRGSVSGMLEKVFHDKIKVGKYYIIKNDLISPDPACFNENQCKKMRNHYVRINFDIPRNDYINTIAKKVTPEIFKANGFLKAGKKWIKIDDVIKSEIEAEIKNLEAEYDKSLEEKVKKNVEAKMKVEGLI